MRCAKCDSDNPSGKKYCGNYGSRLGNSCPKCGGERRRHRLAFADIKCSTEIMEDLDPEKACAIIDPTLQLMMDAVNWYDGYVVQSTGDGIFALVGAPVAHEDHPQRALYAALRMPEELRRYSAKVVADGGTPIQGRIGLNTGEVVVRSIQTGADHVEYTPIGDTINLASRIQTAAPVGSIAVTEATRKLCEGYFIPKPLGATKVKGVSEPVNVNEVTGFGPLRIRLQRTAGRGFTKFVGLSGEMDAMQTAAEQAPAGHGQIVAATAEPGFGKPRLVVEFKAVSQSGWMVLETFSVSHGNASACLPVIDLPHGYFRIASDVVPMLTLCDTLSVTCTLGYGSGRIGCFLAGDGGYSIPIALPWGMSFPDGLVPTIRRMHPLPLFEFATSALIALWLWRWGSLARHLRSANGEVFALFIIWTGVAQFLFEFIKLDTPVSRGLMNVQLVAAISIVRGVVPYCVLRSRDARAPDAVVALANSTPIPMPSPRRHHDGFRNNAWGTYAHAARLDSRAPLRIESIAERKAKVPEYSGSRGHLFKLRSLGG